MATATTMRNDSGTDWCSDASIAYALLRLTFGVNIGMRGLMRVVRGTDGFTAFLLKQFEVTYLPPAMIVPFGHVLPWVELALGVLLILGLWTRPALIIGALMMTSLTFGTMLIGTDFYLALLQLTYAGFWFLLLALRSWNGLSLDAMMAGRRST